MFFKFYPERRHKMRKSSLIVIKDSRPVIVEQDEVPIELVTNPAKVEDPAKKIDLPHDFKIILGKIGEREAKIIRLRYGMGSDMHTLAEVSKIIGVSRERVRQLEERAVKRLRRCAYRMGLNNNRSCFLSSSVYPTFTK